MRPPRIALIACALLFCAACGDAGGGASSRFDGTWRGETSQHRAVELVVFQSRIAILDIGYRVKGGGDCSTSVDVSLVPDAEENWVRHGAFAFDASVDDLADVDGTILDLEGIFADPTHLNGEIRIERHAPCTSESYLWSAQG